MTKLSDKIEKAKKEFLLVDKQYKIYPEMSPEKKDEQVMKLVIRASITRVGQVYNPDKDKETAKKAVHEALKEEVEKLAKQYEKGKKPVLSEEHIENIKTLANNISKECKEYLNNGKFLIGWAQKFLNLYLKYQWCLGRIPCPPHATIDRVILEAMVSAWTKLDDIKEYEKLSKFIAIQAETECEKLTPAEWELLEWNEFIKKQNNS